MTDFAGFDESLRSKLGLLRSFSGGQITGENLDFVAKRGAVYDGLNPFRKEPVCVNCMKFSNMAPSGRLFLCSRCKLVHYCSRECQKKQFARHKSVCKAVANQAEKVQRKWLTFPYTLFESDPFSNDYDEAIFIYIHERTSLADKFLECASFTETSHAMSMALNEYLEILRLEIIGSTNIRFAALYLLLELDRDDDAFSFCTDWLEYYSNEQSFKSRRMAAHKNSREGDWIYQTPKNDRYGSNLFNDYPILTEVRSIQEKVSKYVNLEILCALCIVKMKIVAAHDGRDALYKYFAETKLGKKTKEVGHLIHNFLVGNDKVNVQFQKMQVERLIERIHAQNPSMLPAVLNPNPLMSQPDYSIDVPFHPSAVYCALPRVQRGFQRVFKADKWLAEKFGTRPTYNSDPSFNGAVSYGITRR